MTIERNTAESSRALDNDTSDIPHAIAIQAVEWSVELQGSPKNSRTVIQQISQWRAEHPDHERAWQHIQSVNKQFAFMRSSTGKRLAHTSVVHPAMHSRREMIKALSVLFFAGGAGWVAKQELPWQAWVADVSTGIGERTELKLASGGSVQLNTNTSLNVQVNAVEELLTLLQGEIMVRMIPDNVSMHTGRLRIETDQGSLLPDDAEFLVRHQRNFCDLSVYSGAVDVIPSDNHLAKQRIIAGEQTRFDRASVSTALKLDPNAKAWTQGMIVAKGMRFEDFLNEVARYRTGYVRCSPDIANLRVSGTYPLGHSLKADTDRIFRAVEQSLGVKAHYLTRYFVSFQAAA
ncbi:FecR domain-containing protein [Litoribrevibacter euphylliae]|uniref:FecR domain-containing protein n=1 Tax=Litoribrevibacter euphylliae TaxID=1834034 RepID=A0ABV7HKU4_9GAMM